MTTAPACGVFPYVTRVVHDYLRPLLDPAVRIATNVPPNYHQPGGPDLLVTIGTASTAGGDNIALSKRMVIIQCYHDDETTAAELAELVFAHMKCAYYVPGNGIRDVEVVGSPALFPDPDDSTPRFQMTLVVLLRAQFH